MRPRSLLFFALALLMLGFVQTSDAQTFTCSPPAANQIVCENSQPGTPENQWMIIGSGDSTIQGFTTSISVNQGETVHFKIKTDASSYRLDIFRMGYYQGNGARFLTSVFPSAQLPQTQPACLTDSTTGLIDCGNWAESASWTVPSNATSGIYFAELTRLDTGGGSMIFFIVRADSSNSAILFQTSDTAWQAYNIFGGNNLYTANTSAGRAYKVSYNRPFQTSDYNSGQTWVYNAEYPMIRWLEANGYDMTYATGVDTDRFGSLLLNHKLFMSVGHDEYWSGAQRANVEAARAAGVHLAFFSANEVFWKTRWENSTDGSNTPYRTLVCYKETHANQPIDPKDPPTWTGTWRDPRFSPPADGGRPENALSGTIFYVNGTRNDAITVPAAFGKLRFWRNTNIARLGTGQVATLPTGTLGFEWDQDVDNGFRPAGLIDLSSTTINVNGFFLNDYGNTFGPGTATHSLTLYRASSGSIVFAAGTVQWPWGLDSHHTNGSNPPDPNMQQATVNLLADMGLQPATLQAGVVPATASTNTTPPISTITSPTSGASVQSGSNVTIAGSASAGGGGVVAGVEVSVDGGTTWHRATGLNNWTYSWVPAALGSVTLKSRAVDDSLNLEAPSAGVAVTVTGSPPVISNVQATMVTSSGATITWTTDVTSTSQVNYGTTVSYGSSTPINNSPVTNHAVSLTGLAANTLYHFQVLSQGGNGSLAVSSDFTFTTAATSGSGTITLWSPSTTPTNASASDTSSVEVGVKFTSDLAGYILGIRFYKGTVNTGTHAGNLWTASGTLLASANFGGETASGWQEVDFSTPVAISANTVYVASYHAPNGGYSIDRNYFANAGYDNAPLHALKDGASGGDGVFLYGANPGFPINTYLSTNYWVDVVFTAAAGPVALSSVTLNPVSVTGGNPSTGTVTLSGPAPSGGAVVSLSSNNPAIASVPAGGSMTVPAGATTATFPMNTSAVATSTTVTISASYGGTLAASLTVVPPVLSSLTLSLTSVTGGTSSPTGTVTLSGPAPSGGAVVSLSSNNPAVASVPASGSMTVPAGATTATFPMNTSAVATSTTVTISASSGGTLTASLTVIPPVVSSLALNPSSVTGGPLLGSSTGTVTLNGPAPDGGAFVSLSSSNPSVATVPGSVTIAPGATTATFPVNTSVVITSQTVTISGSYNNTTRSANLTVHSAVPGS